MWKVFELVPATMSEQSFWMYLLPAVLKFLALRCRNKCSTISVLK